MQNKKKKLAQKWKFYKGGSMFWDKTPRNLHSPSEFEQLRKRCLASIRDFHAEGEVVDTADGIYIYRNSGANILAVAHLDVVLPGPRHFGHSKKDPDKIYNAQLDDRLGAYTILDVLPTLGIKVDVLLTTGEETCRSTAAHFHPNKEYNWLIEFDRAGSDVVLYDYWTVKLEELLEKQGNKVGVGSYSDISVMEHLGVAGFNWGIGYHENHWAGCYFRSSEYATAIQRFQEFHSAYKDKKFSHTPCEYYSDDDTDPWGYSRNQPWRKEEVERWREYADSLSSAAPILDDRVRAEEEERIMWEEEEFRRDWNKYKVEHGEEEGGGPKHWEDSFPYSETASSISP